MEGGNTTNLIWTHQHLPQCLRLFPWRSVAQTSLLSPLWQRGPSGIPATTTAADPNLEIYSHVQSEMIHV